MANATAADAITALDAACAVQADWARHPARERGEILRSVFEAIIERRRRLRHPDDPKGIRRVPGAWAR